MEESNFVDLEFGGGSSWEKALSLLSKLAVSIAESLSHRLNIHLVAFI